MTDAIGGLCSLVEKIARARIRFKGFVLFDAERGEYATHLHVGRIGIFMLDEAVQHIESAAVDGVEHIGRHRGRIGELHRLGRRFLAKRINARLFHNLDRRAKLLWILKETAPEHEYSVGARPEREVSLGRFALEVRRQQEISASLALVGAGQTDVAAPDLAADFSFRTNRPLEEVVENALEAGRHLDYHRPIFLQVEIAERIDYV